MDLKPVNRTVRADILEDLDCRLAWKIEKADVRQEMEVDLKRLYQDQWTNSGSPTRALFKHCGVLVQVLSEGRHSPILASLTLRIFNRANEASLTKLVSVIPFGTCVACVDDLGLMGIGFDLEKMNDMVRYKYGFKIPITYNLSPASEERVVARLSGFPQSDMMIYFYGFLRRSG